MIDGARLALDLPRGFCMAHVPMGRADDRHACGREAARRALVALGVDASRLAYDGTRPMVEREASGTVSISITHGRHAAVAIAARVARIGIDLCDDDPRLPALAERFLVDEQAIAKTPLDLSACFAAKEAALKALGLGLLDGGILDGTAVRVVSLAPPRLSHEGLHLALARISGGAIAVVYG